MLNQNIIQDSLKIIDNILEMLSEVFLTLKPLIKEIAYLKRTKQLKSTFNFVQVADLFAEISETCKRLKIQDFPDEFYSNLKN